MKKLLILVFICLVWSLNAEFAGGNGTEQNPYQVSTATHLNSVRNYLGSFWADLYFVQTANINLSGYSNWVPIGSIDSSNSNSFYGNYDGNGFTISNLSVSRTSDCGLFGVLKDGSVKNVILSSSNVSGSGQRIGSLIGFVKLGQIENCSSSGTISGGQSVGGLIGYIEDGSINNCFSSASVSGTISKGGLIGGSSRSYVTYSYAVGNVSGSGLHAGGLIGSSSNSEISFCYATGNVTSPRANLGGLIGDFFGSASNSSKVIQCFSTGNVNYTGTANTWSTTGGLIGSNIDGIVIDSYSHSAVTSTGYYVGGFVGRNHTQYYSSVISRCYATGSVSGSSDFNGFAGANTSVSNPISYIYNSFWNVETDGIDGNTSGANNWGATGKTTNEMTSDAFFSPNIYLADNWDFKGEVSNGEDEIWNIGNSRNQNYPYFDWQYPNDPACYDLIHSTQSLPPDDPDPDPIEFTGTGVTIDFSGVSGATGANDITVSKYNETPTNLGGLIGSEVNVAGTSFLFTNLTGFSFTSTLQFLISELPGVNLALFSDYDNGTPTDIRLWKRSEYGTGDFVDQGYLLYNKGADFANVTSDDYLYLEGITSFSEITFTSDEDHPLPVTLSSFTAGIDAGLPVLWWTTESEQENMGWNLYRSNDENGINVNNFLQLNEILIPGMGTTTQPTSYFFVDEHNIAAPGAYWYWLQSVSFSGELEMFGPVSLQIGEGGIPDLPQYSSLQANYPNPFNPVTTIEFSIREGDSGTMAIYNIAGQKILEKEYPAGNHLFQWNADDQASGVYLYQLKTPSYNKINKALLLK